MNELSKLSEKIEQAKKEQEKEIGVAGFWECAYCGIKVEQIINPYFPNMPDFCSNRSCRESAPTPKFLFIKWEILK